MKNKESKQISDERLFNRIKSFLEFSLLPKEDETIDWIMVLSTSPIIDPISYNMRVNMAKEYAAKFPNSKMIVSGKRPDASRATPEEMQPNYAESELMAEKIGQELSNYGEIMVEVEATSAKENVQNSLNKISIDPTTKILFICSSYMARRVHYYLIQELKKHGLDPKTVQFYIVDADVIEDLEHKVLTEEEVVRKEKNIVYEWERLVKYRHKGDL